MYVRTAQEPALNGLIDNNRLVTIQQQHGCNRCQAVDYARGSMDVITKVYNTSRTGGSVSDCGLLARNTLRPPLLPPPAKSKCYKNVRRKSASAVIESESPRKRRVE